MTELAFQDVVAAGRIAARRIGRFPREAINSSPAFVGSEEALAAARRHEA